MNVHVLRATMVSLLRHAAAVLSLALIVVIACASHAARADSTDIAYDQLIRVDMSSSPPVPGTYQNGSFQADFQAAVNASKPQKHGGLFAMVQMAKQTFASLKSGFPTSYYWWTGLERDEDPAKQTATIYRPDRNYEIKLDMANKTYQIITAQTGPPPQMTNPQPQQPTGPQQPMPSPQPGTGKVKVTVTTSALGTKMFDTEQGTGYKVDFKLQSTESTGSCQNGTFETVLIEYLSRYPQPILKRPTAAPVHIPQNPMTTQSEQMAVHPGCKPKFSTEVHIGPPAPEGRLPLWTQLTLSAGMQGTQGGFTSMTETGDIHPLSASDAPLFDIPAGYTKLQPSPNP